MKLVILFLRCTRLKEKFPFIDEPLSEEEKEFPLAYGILVYKSAFQVYMMMSAIYHPQNIYCVSIDEKSTKEFKDSMLLLTDCFPNIFVMVGFNLVQKIILKASVNPVGWCEFGVARSLYNCFRYLTEHKHDWKYFQYLSGFDLPLKTNLEVYLLYIFYNVNFLQMVRIFKQLNRSINMQVSLYPTNRLGAELKPPLPLWKSSMSSLFPREAANVMVSSSKVHELLRFLEQTICSDETVWTTVAGNPQELKIPGGFNAAAFHFERTECVKHKKGNITAIIEQEVKAMAERHPNEPFLPDNYYISRYQVWDVATLHKCYSQRYRLESCVFGIKDIPYLLKRPELVQHKMYLSFQPAGSRY
ncbi:unnamed protein product [Meloidogyne enterolobii]|uniref:Uncharacterized protein n=1 Tax=Meloidogyne enterolobii TaxID=390850 RepID=A0ACB1AYA7_MELEN